jgi:hypothetical protein
MASSEREGEKKLIIIMITYNALMTNRVKNREARNSQKAMQKQLWSCFHISKNSRCFFWQPEVAGFKKRSKNRPRKPSKNRNVNHPIVVIARPRARHKSLTLYPIELGRRLRMTRIGVIRPCMTLRTRVLGQRTTMTIYCRGP